MSKTEEIDDSLYSRQRYVLGDGAMHKLAKSNVLIFGLGGVGVEVAKNVILAGVKSVTLFDDQPCSEEDLGTQFFLRKEDVELKMTRAAACCKRLAELNPYVSVVVIETDPLGNLQLLNDFQCVLVTEMLMEDQIKINSHCRRQTPAIPYISCDVHGVFSYLFCDFGDSFEVHDINGEESKEAFISSIKKGNPTVIETLEYWRHGLETGDQVLFKGIEGMSCLNGRLYRVTYINPSEFSIDVNSLDFPEYKNGGVFSKVKQTVGVKFESLQQQLRKPELLINDLSKFESPTQCHLGVCSLHQCLSKGMKKSQISNNKDEFLVNCEAANKALENPLEKIDRNLLEKLAVSCTGQLASLCAAIGGIGAQEVLKSLSGKFMPLKQWLFIDCVELCDSSKSTEIIKSEGRYFHLSQCLSEELIKDIRNTKLFMVGCGAIGCEMLKNYALLGVGTGDKGLITITDNDLIEKSNLNRQFLFRPRHIQKPKSSTASESAKEINPELRIESHQNKVCPETEEVVYNDTFFQQQHIIVNALDNVEARRYVDSRCVTNQRPLIETGTMGSKGHVQVVVPFLTESYSDQRDPADESVPYCTLKSFPQVIEHTIQWARDKFESVFNLKPTTFNKFWQENGPPGVFKNTLTSESNLPDGFVESVRLLQKQPNDWNDCIALARTKFEVYFNHKALQLIHAFPLDSLQKDGTLFWQSPKRPPNPIQYSSSDDTHLLFIKSCACLIARIYGVKVKKQDVQPEVIKSILENVEVPKFRAINKAIETDESKTKESSETPPDENKIKELFDYLKKTDVKEAVLLSVEHFEKDDDSNSHIDFITSASNLRATMYGIEVADRFKTKKIAGRIIPAIATTTAAIAGLASIELIKVIAKRRLESLKNCFLNLALPMMVLSEPGPPAKTIIKNGLDFTIWDRWQVEGNKDYKLQDFIDHFKSKYNLKVSMVCEGVRMIYMPVMPGHMKRVKDTMLKLLKPSASVKYTDLVIGFEPIAMDSDDDLPAPPVRYHFYSS